jgi:hypothetical protein
MRGKRRQFRIAPEENRGLWWAARIQGYQQDHPGCLTAVIVWECLLQVSNKIFAGVSTDLKKRNRLKIYWDASTNYFLLIVRI